ncbi:MAG: Uma2 family endonuclease [Planctomycetes bacterium]|nr:Uma2 family endonuclease [Planctomycetota bacterium]
MRAVMLEVPLALLEERRRLGLDRWDEMWKGELHMVPPPHGDHGRLLVGLAAFFRLHWEALGLGRTYLETGVKRPGTGEDPALSRPTDYRVPDLSFLLPERYGRFVDGWIVGGPDAVLEVVSPGDESREKLPFYADLDVREVIFLDRLTRTVEVLRASQAGWAQVTAGADGWVRSDVLRTEWRTEGATLRVRRWDEPAREMPIEV